MSYFVNASIPNNDIINNKSIRNECAFRWGNDMVKYLLKSINNNFRNNSVNNIILTNQSVFDNLSGLSNSMN